MNLTEHPFLRSVAATVLMVSSLFCSFALPYAGYLVDRFGARIVVLTGCACRSGQPGRLHDATDQLLPVSETFILSLCPVAHTCWSPLPPQCRHAMYRPRDARLR